MGYVLLRWLWVLFGFLCGEGVIFWIGSSLSKDLEVGFEWG